MKRLLLICSALILSSCQIDPPKLDYSLARVAMRSADETEAAKYAPGYWHKAQTTYSQAQIFYRDQDNEMAQKYFNRARIYAERAENASKLARSQGDGF